MTRICNDCDEDWDDEDIDVCPFCASTDTFLEEEEEENEFTEVSLDELEDPDETEQDD